MLIGLIFVHSYFLFFFLIIIFIYKKPQRVMQGPIWNVSSSHKSVMLPNYRSDPFIYSMSVNRCSYVVYLHTLVYLHTC